jgi:outer membrane usher protein
MLSLKASAEIDLFEKVFQKKTEKVVSLPLFFERSFLGEVLAKITNGAILKSIEKSTLINLIENNLREEIVSKIKVSEKKYLSKKELESLGINTGFDSKNLYVFIEIPSHLRRLKGADLSFNRIPRWANGAKKSQGVSGFLNLLNYYNDSDLVANDSYTSDQSLNLNFGNLSLLGQTSWQRDSESRFIRQDFRLTYDWQEHLMRAQLGDLNYQVSDYQSFQSGAGLLVSTNFNLNPYRLFNPMSFREITLNAPSRVRVFINEVLVQTLRLPSGRHRLDNLPLNEGINNIRLEIQDNRGRQEDVSFTGTTSFSLIGRGLHDFTYGGGVPAEDALGDRRYDTNYKKYFYVANHLYGLNDSVNVGYGLMGNSLQRLLSVKGLMQNSWGLSTLNVSGAQLLKPSTGNGGVGSAARFTHLFRDYQNKERRLRTFDLALEYLGVGFVPMETLVERQEASVRPEIGYTQFLSDYLNVRLRGSYRFNSKNSNQNFYNGSLASTLLFKRFYQFSGQYSFSGFRSGEKDHQLLFSFNWSLPSSGQVVTTSYNTKTYESTGQVSFTGQGRPSRWRGQGNIRKSPQRKQYEVELGRESQRYNANFSYLMRDGNDGIDSRTKTANFSTAVAFAGGQFSLSRPINESFALVATSGAIRDYSLYLNKNSDHYEAETGILGSAVLPNYQAYRFYPIRIDSRALPFGIEVPPEEVVVEAPYRGGVLIDIFSKQTKALVGKVSVKGIPIPLKTGRLVGADKSSYHFFTNRKGRFLVESILPGKYQLSIEGRFLGELNIPKEGDSVTRWEHNYE